MEILKSQTTVSRILGNPRLTVGHLQSLYGTIEHTRDTYVLLPTDTLGIRLGDVVKYDKVPLYEIIGSSIRNVGWYSLLNNRRKYLRED